MTGGSTAAHPAAACRTGPCRSAACARRRQSEPSGPAAIRPNEAVGTYGRPMVHNTFSQSAQRQRHALVHNPVCAWAAQLQHSAAVDPALQWAWQDHAAPKSPYGTQVIAQEPVRSQPHALKETSERGWGAQARHAAGAVAGDADPALAGARARLPAAQPLPARIQRALEQQQRHALVVSGRGSPVHAVECAAAQACARAPPGRERLLQLLAVRAAPGSQEGLPGSGSGVSGALLAPWPR